MIAHVERGYSAYEIVKEMHRIKSPTPYLKEFLIAITYDDKETIRAALYGDREGCLKYADVILRNGDLCRLVCDSRLLAEMELTVNHSPYYLPRSNITDESLLDIIIINRKWERCNIFMEYLQTHRPHVMSELIRRGYRQRIRYISSVELYLTCEEFNVDFRRRNNGGWKGTRRIINGTETHYNYDVHVSPVMIEYIARVAPHRMSTYIKCVNVHYKSIERLKELISYTEIYEFFIHEEHKDDVLGMLYNALIEGGYRDTIEYIMYRLRSGRRSRSLCWCDFEEEVTHRQKYLLPVDKQQHLLGYETDLRELYKPIRVRRGW